MSIKKEVLAYLKANKSQLLRDFHLVKIGIVGSVAREEDHENSDIDLIIELKEGTSDLFRTREALRKSISNHFSRKVDLCSEKYINTIFREYVLRTAVYA